MSVSPWLGWCAQERSEAGRDLTSKHRISNCSDIAHAIGPHLYVQVKEQFGLMHWHRSFPSTSSLAPHLTSSGEGGRAERVIYWTHLFICQTFSPHNLWHVYLLKCLPSHGGPGRSCRSEQFSHWFHNLWSWFDESSWIICDGGFRCILD